MKRPSDQGANIYEEEEISKKANSSYLEKMIKKNDGSGNKVIQMAAVERVHKVASQNHKRFQIIEFEDALALKILISQNGDELRSFCQDRNINYRLRRDKKPAFIEVSGTEQRDMMEDDLEEFGYIIKRFKENIQRGIKEKIIPCNQEEYVHISKQLDDYIDALNSTEVKFIDPEGNQDEVNPEVTYNPDLIKAYEINGKFILKLLKIEKPSLLGFSTIDLLLLNIEPDSIFTDPFGYEVVSKNSFIKELIKKNKDKIENESMIYNLTFPYQNKVIFFSPSTKFNLILNQDINLCIQTSKNQDKCIQNLKELFGKIDKQELQSKGFLNLGISLNPSCSKKYFVELLKYINKIADEDSYLSFPSEIQIFVPEDKEGTILSYLTDVIKNKTINPEKMKKGGSWGYAIQYYGQANINYNYSNMNFTNVNVATTPFKEAPSISIEKAFLREDKKSYIATPALIQAQQVVMGYYKRGKKVNVRNEEEDEEMIEEIEVNFEKMTETLITSGIERPISQDPKKKSKWSYVDTISQDFVAFEEEICKVFKYCAEHGIPTFNYQRNLIDFSLSSKIMKVDFTLSSMVDLSSGDVFAIKREENSKYNYLVEEANPDSKLEHINLIEQKKEKPKQPKEDANKMEEEKNVGPHLKIRGLSENIEIVSDIYDGMKKNKFTTHIIQVGRKLGKSTLKYLQEIAKSNNIDLNYDEKTEELFLKGYKKTINKIRPQIIQGFKIKFDEFSIPPDWEQQDEDVEVFDCKLDTEYSRHIIKLVKKSLPNAKFHKIQRIQNLNLWKNFQFEKKKLEEKGDASEKWLFHGTRNTDPSVIYKGTEEGFDFRVCGGGMYGRGTYFHDLASYSFGFGHQKNGKVQLFCAKVLIGRCYATPPNGQMTAPPYVPGSKSIRYDSIRSNGAIGSNEYVIFNNSKAYPYYLITITNGGGGIAQNAFFGGINNYQGNGNDDDDEDEEDYLEDDEY